MLTNKAKYSLRAMCALSLLPQGGRLQAHAIAERTNVPVKFLEAILVDLRRAGFIESRRGQLGGHALARPATAIMVGDVIRAIDGPLAPVRCASLSAYEPCSDCADPATCGLRALMRETREALSGVLDTCSLLALSQRESLLSPPSQPTGVAA